MSFDMKAFSGIHIDLIHSGRQAELSIALMWDVVALRLNICAFAFVLIIVQF